VVAVKEKTRGTPYCRPSKACKQPYTSYSKRDDSISETIKNSPEEKD
jgi:hypothetical protein